MDPNTDSPNMLYMLFNLFSLLKNSLSYKQLFSLTDIPLELMLLLCKISNCT